MTDSPFMFKLTSQSLEKINLKKSLASPLAGAFSSFEGWVRNQHEGKKVIALQYEAHEKLCLNESKKIIAEAKRKFNLINVRIFHRVGHLKVGEMAVWIGVVASHRDSAFKACRYLIDEIKKRLPIWKREIYRDGDSGWVNCEIGSHTTVSPLTKNQLL